MVVALLSEKADVQYVPDLVDPDHIVTEIQDLGFGAELISEAEQYQEGTIDIAVSGVSVCGSVKCEGVRYSV